MDNCANFHFCRHKSLFVGEIRDAPNVRVKGISGTSQATCIGIINFAITDKEGNGTEILLKNFIYLPESPKNLISVSRWSRDKRDDCGILSRVVFFLLLGT